MLLEFNKGLKVEKDEFETFESHRDVKKASTVEVSPFVL